MKEENKKKENKKEEKAQNTTRKKVVLIVLSVVLLILIAASAVFAYAWFNKPEDKSDSFGELPTMPPSVNVNPPSSGGVETGDNNGEEEEIVAPPQLNAQKGVYNFLLLCKDRVGLNTDVMMIVNLNTVSNSITVLQIPRDTYIELDIHHGKINALFARYYVEGSNAKEKNPTSYGLRKMCETLQYNMYMPLQGAVLLNIEGFCNIVDIIGGVEVNVPADMVYHDDAQNLHIDLKKGPQLLDGNKAEQFVRFRSGYVTADIGRMDAQKIFMSAFLKKVKASFNVDTIVKLANQVVNHVTMENISTLDMVSYAKCLLEMDFDNIKFISMPGLNAGGENNWYHVMVRKNMYGIINEHFNIFDTDIPEWAFDINRVFTSTELYPKINELYTKEDYVGDKEYSANDAEQGIDIPRI